jgi:hypothetical protein
VHSKVFQKPAVVGSPTIDDEYCVLETGTSLSSQRERGGVRVEFVIAPPHLRPLPKGKGVQRKIKKIKKSLDFF